MATWTSLVVLSLAVVSTLSFPRPGTEYKIPNVGLGSRAQYYVLHSDGSFKYGYDTGDGFYEQSMAQVPGEVTGAFGYKDPTGADIKLEYTADERGFLPRGGHLPVAPESDFGAKVKTASVAAVRSPATSFVAASPSVVAAPTPAALPAKPVEVAQVRSTANEDGSYSFAYKTSSSSQSQSSDAQNSVRGNYAFTADDGVNREISYVAGSATGYIAEGDSLPVGPAVPGAESGIPTGRILPVLSEEEANALAVSSTFDARPQAPSVSVSRSNIAQTSSSVVGVKSAPTGSSDASYSFSYDAGDSSRSESADADLNVEGSFSFVPPQGQRLTVNYVAGSDTGFLATGDHLPTAPETGITSQIRTATSTGGVTAYSAPESAPTSPRKSSVPGAATPVEIAQVRSSSNDDGSYSFTYKTSSSSRSESADAENSVAGQYSFVADDGINREIKYIAGAETGYIAEGDSLPVGPSVPGAESGIPTGRIFPILSEEEANELAAATSGSASATAYVAPSSPSESSASLSDASYSFQYDARDSARQESANADLNVHGSFSFVPPEGNRLTVNYVAGSDTGFIAEGDHLPKVSDTISESLVSGAAVYSAPVAVPAPAPTLVGLSPTNALPTPSEVAQVRSSADNDGSYSFSYETSDSSRSESANSQNSVTGHYAFVADDGLNRKINYIAGSETGYIAEGDSLPVGPSVPGAESGIPTGRIVPVLSEEEANALARASPVSAPVPLLKTSDGSDAVIAPADASYSFSFDSETYSRNEEADADGNVVGSYTYVDENGEEHTVTFVAGRETGFVPEGFPTPSPASQAVSASAAVRAGSYSKPSSSLPSAGGAAFSGESSLRTDLQPATPSQRASLSEGHSSRVVGDVLLHQYDSVNRNKYGYVFTALRR